MDDDELPLPDFAGAQIEGLRDPKTPPPVPKKPEPFGGAESAVGGNVFPADDAPPLELETDGGETWAVFLMGFPHVSVDEVAPEVAKMFGLDVATASSLILNAPITVKRGASRETATSIESALRSLGADVDIRPETTERRQRRESHRAAASSAAKKAIEAQNAAAMQAAHLGLPAEAATPLAHGPLAHGPAVALPGGAPRGVSLDGDHPGFWTRIPMAFVVPFFGTGILWLIGLTVMLFVVAFVRAAPCIGIFMMPIAGAVYLGLLGIYFGQAAQAGLEDDGSRPQPRWYMPSQGELLARGGPLVLVTFLLFVIPAGLAWEGSAGPVVYIAGLIPYFYWPMALTVSGITGSSLSLFNPIEIGRGILAGGLPYLMVVLVGFLVFAGLSMLPIIALTAHSTVGILVSVLVMAGAVGYIAGVQGYLMGCIVGSRSEKFAPLLGGD